MDITIAAARGEGYHSPAMTTPGDETAIGGAQRGFCPTSWTDVLRAGDPQAPGAAAALERLIGLYWRPVYFFVRRKGRSVEDAKDLTQEFFCRLLERNALARADRGRGKFRTFLLASMEHFLCDDYDRGRVRAQARPFDFAAAEAQFRSDHSFERDWALALLERAFARLESENPRLAEMARAAESAGGLRGAGEGAGHDREQCGRVGAPREAASARDPAGGAALHGGASGGCRVRAAGSLPRVFRVRNLTLILT
ncbi:MAG: sigma-70 family RNA polymerase sigma factor [Planctomycetes bacterium]|nr:sigma-70 family RNA polymerase sigma factor [Planctomycetota bacterium]